MPYSKDHPDLTALKEGLLERDRLLKSDPAAALDKLGISINDVMKHIIAKARQDLPAPKAESLDFSDLLEEIE